MPKANYGEDGLKLRPTHARRSDDRRKCDPDVWFYEEREGICVCFATPEGAKIAYLPRAAVAEYVHITEGMKRGEEN